MVIRELAKVAFSADVHIATGTVFEYQRWATKQSGYCDGATWFVGDFNGDGKMDMMKEWDSNGKLNADMSISPPAANLNIKDGRPGKADIAIPCNGLSVTSTATARPT
jgi:hypothetical protein